MPRRSGRKRYLGLALDLASVGADFEPRESDVMLTSYPRSGNTWVRFLLANLLRPDTTATFSNIESAVPDVYQNSDREIARVALQPRIIKSHEPFRADYRRVIYIVRNPLDVAVSYFSYHQKKREIPEDMSLAVYVDGMLEGRWDAFGTWGEHVGGWLGARSTSDEFLLLRYEDMRERPQQALETIGAFIGVTSESAVATAVQRSDLQHMRALEAVSSSNWKTVKGSREDIPFVGGGLVGRGEQMLPATVCEMIRDRWREPMSSLGYAPDAVAAKEQNG